MTVLKSFHAARVTDYSLLKITSEAFEPNGFIPKKYSCNGININPSLDIEGLMSEAKSLAIIVDDPDAPGGSFCHWAVWNIPLTHHIKEAETKGIAGRNDFGTQGYSGPCPPTGTHRYLFKLYALDCILDLDTGANKTALEKAMAEHILGFGLLTGKYSQQ